MATVTETATAAGSGANATFAKKERTTGTVDPARVSAIATDALAALHEVIRRHEVGYAEYDALKAWMIPVGADGEWPMFLDVFVEHVVEEVAHADRKGAVGTIEGPYYVPGAPESHGETTMSMREDERGTPLLFQGTVTDLDGGPVAGAKVDLWHADDAGYYPQFAHGIPEWNLRAVVTTGADGHFAFHTVQPAHLHLKVSALGKASVTTQLYFDGGDYVADDVAQAVKPELVLRPTPVTDGSGDEVTYDFALDPA
ncbi:dioxygenase family protein [Pseudonocardia sp. HH130630-07]|uniref:dioxygenase family protein n=1 Tax=Pseudonocardia sp. HH130630-07 TaxID=1690815 RepID=UPI00081525F1|nr:dioxygenase [Pseudonocardia sp. HH130630-07]ANY10721.1 catechol 1,2-dioxygenase [Pseudonocardia sp. HH130630-07]